MLGHWSLPVQLRFSYLNVHIDCDDVDEVDEPPMNEAIDSTTSLGNKCVTIYPVGQHDRLVAHWSQELDLRPTVEERG